VRIASDSERPSTTFDRMDASTVRVRVSFAAPPTALIVDEPSLCVAVLQHFSRLKLSSPENVSLACTDMSDAFEWCDPSITHIAWESRPIMNRVVKWADNISRGKDPRRKYAGKVRLVLGGTIGPAPKER